MSSLWIVDDEPVICSVLEKTFKSQGHRVRVFSAAEPAIELATKAALSTDEQAVPDLVVMDVRLPGMDGLDAVKEINAHLPNVPIIVMTAFGDLPTAVRAMEGKVFEYITKPFDLETAIAIAERAIGSKVHSPNQLQSMIPLVENSSTGAGIYGTSPVMQELYKGIAMAAMSDCPVLLRGESGTGKELVARAIHQHSSRRQEPFLAIAPVAVNPSLIESELFGHERGSFTGADFARRGVFELAGRGTILLDEIGDLPTALQVKLLRVLEQREFFPVGSSCPKAMNARVIAATHRNLSQMVASNEFREDLYFRLAVFTLDLPSLRQRPSDIVPLAALFLHRHGYANDSSVLSDQVIDILNTYTWPGNVRELRNAMDHAAVLARGNRIHVEHLPGLVQLNTNQVSSTSPSLSLRFDELVRSWVIDQIHTTNDDSEASRFASDASVQNMKGEAAETLYETFLRTVEPPLLRALLDSCQGNRAAAAQKLGLHRSTLRQKMRSYELDSRYPLQS